MHTVTFSRAQRSWCGNSHVPRERASAVRIAPASPPAEVHKRERAMAVRKKLNIPCRGEREEPKEEDGEEEEEEEEILQASKPSVIWNNQAGPSRARVLPTMTETSFASRGYIARVVTGRTEYSVSQGEKSHGRIIPLLYSVFPLHLSLSLSLSFFFVLSAAVPSDDVPSRIHL